MADVTTLILTEDITDLLIEDDAQTIVAENEPEHINSVDIRTVILFQDETIVVSVGEAGPQGAPGSSGTSDISETAGQPLSAGRLVTATPAGAFYYDPTDLTQYGKLIGITKAAANMGDAVTIATIGAVTLVGIGFTAGSRFWAGPNGTLLTSPPVSGLVVPVGYAIDTDTMNLQLGSYLEF